MKTIARPSAHKTCGAPEPADPRVRRTRKLLEDAFRTLVEKKSFAALSVQDITDYAMVNRATFYAHYTDKHDLAASVLRHDLKNTMLKRFHESPTFTPENLVEMAVGFFSFIEELYSACPKAASEMAGAASDTLQSELYEIMTHWLSGNSAHLRLFPHSSKTTVATVISWSIYGSALSWIRSPNREPAPQVCREIVAMLLPPASR